MGGNDLVFGLLRSPADPSHATLQEKLRGFTISWLRYGYPGPIIEASAITDILNAAITAGYRYCFVQWPGNVILEPWTPQHRRRLNFHESLAEWMQGRDFFAAGRFQLTPSNASGFADQCLLVNLADYQALGRPSYGSAGQNLFQAGTQHGRPVVELPQSITDFMLPLHANHSARSGQFSRFLDEAIASFESQTADDCLTAAQRRFLTVVRRHTSRARNGVFLWNVESYQDAAEPSAAMTGPVSTLYSVAAGFKPNWFLHTHGFDANTRVVFFDYSAHALEFRRLLREEWDGADYPRFLRHVFRKLPHPETFYHLWNDMSPDDLKPGDIEAVWQDELAKWGGERAFKDHWQAFVKLRHHYVHCDIRAEQDRLLDHVRAEPNAVIWWSNAFFTVISNWFQTVDQRKQIYDDWIAGLAARNPRLLLYGFDYNNISVNQVQAGAYWDGYQAHGASYLTPYRANKIQIRS